MPHCVLEYSANIKDSVNFHDFFARLHELLASSGEIEKNRIKSRWYCRENYLIGDGNKNRAFVNLQISLLTGRSLEVRKKIGAQAFDLLANQYPRSQRDLSCSITLEVREINNDTHFKLTKSTVPE